MRKNKLKTKFSDDRIELVIYGGNDLRPLYKAKANLNDEKQLALVFSYLKKFDVDIDKINKRIEKEKKNFWFS